MANNVFLCIDFSRMIGIDSNILLKDLENITQANLDFVEQQVKPLSSEQLNWKLSADAWNVIQVLAHLNAYASYYQKAIREKIKITRFKQPVDIFVSSPLGRSAWKSVKLGNLKNMKRKLRTPRNYNPNFNKSLIAGTEIEDFILFQQDLTQLLEAAKNVNLRRVRIPISLSKFIKLRLGDAFMFHVYHNERHIEQINRILQNPRFPR